MLAILAMATIVFPMGVRVGVLLSRRVSAAPRRHALQPLFSRVVVPPGAAASRPAATPTFPRNACIPTIKRNPSATPKETR